MVLPKPLGQYCDDRELHQRGAKHHADLRFVGNAACGFVDRNAQKSRNDNPNELGVIKSCHCKPVPDKRNNTAGQARQHHLPLKQSGKCKRQHQASTQEKNAER